MQTYRGTHQGTLQLDQDTEILGMVTGKVTVDEGCRLLLRGQITADLEVFGVAEIVGTVRGTVFNHGEVILSGTVGALVEEHTGVTRLLETGVVRER